jgi:hypothetical protein
MNSVDRSRESSGARLWIYRVFLTVACIVAAAVVIFFVIGMADGWVSSFNAGIWLVALVVVGVVLLAGIRLARSGHHVAAIFVLAILAVPGILYVLFLILLVASGASWN